MTFNVRYIKKKKKNFSNLFSAAVACAIIFLNCLFCLIKIKSINEIKHNLFSVKYDFQCEIYQILYYTFVRAAVACAISLVKWSSL